MQFGYRYRESSIIDRRRVSCAWRASLPQIRVKAKENSGASEVPLFFPGLLPAPHVIKTFMERDMAWTHSWYLTAKTGRDSAPRIAP